MTIQDGFLCIDCIFHFYKHKILSELGTKLELFIEQLWRNCKTKSTNNGKYRAHLVMFYKLVFKNYFLFFNLKTSFKKHGQTDLCFPFIFKN